MRDGAMRGRFAMLLTGFTLGLAIMLLLQVQARGPRTVTRAAMRSIAAYLSTDGSSFLPDAPANHAWREISLAEYDTLMKALIDADCIDCPKADPKSGYPCDAWGSFFEFAVRAAEPGALEFQISSKGPDRLSGTSDDLKIVRLARAEGHTASSAP